MMIILELKKTLIGPIHINTWSCNCLRIAASAADGSSKLFITKSMPSPNDSVLHKWETELGPLVAMAGKPRRTSFEVKRQKRLQKKHRRSMFKGFLSKQYIIAFAAMDIYIAINSVHTTRSHDKSDSSFKDLQTVLKLTSNRG